MRDEAAFRRTVALLVALAVLCDRFAAGPRPLRWITLFFLRHGEEAARRYVAETAYVVLLPLAMMKARVDSRAEALLLAARFRVMAAAILSMLRLAVVRLACLRRRRYGPSCAPLRLVASRAGLARVTQGCRGSGSNDTS